MKIKILVDAHIFDHSFQGSGSYLQGLYNALIQFEDIELTICAHDLDNAKRYFEDPRFKFIELKTNSKIKRLAFEYPKIIKNGKFDYAHFTYILPLFKNCKYVLTIHDILFLEFKSFFSWSYRLIKGNLFKISAKRADIMLTISQYSKEALINIFNIAPDKIFVTPIAVNTTEAKNININIKIKYNIHNYILYVSRFEPRKNHIGLLEAYLSLKLYNEGYQLVFIGSKSEKIELNAYNKLVKMIPVTVKENIKFFENISQDELNSFYQNAACSVYPSFAEGFGIPPLEAAVNGCKVLCSNQTALADFNFFKYHFDPRDTNAFKMQLMEILGDKAYPFDKIKQEILKRYNWSEIAKKYYAIIQNNFISL